MQVCLYLEQVPCLSVTLLFYKYNCIFVICYCDSAKHDIDQLIVGMTLISYSLHMTVSTYYSLHMTVSTTECFLIPILEK